MSQTKQYFREREGKAGFDSPQFPAPSSVNQRPDSRRAVHKNHLHLQILPRKFHITPDSLQKQDVLRPSFTKRPH